jgi:excisionase family DNA binding protein
MDSNDRYLTVRETSQLFKVHPKTIFRWLESGQLKGGKIGRTWRIRKSDIDKLFEKEVD